MYFIKLHFTHNSFILSFVFVGGFRDRLAATKCFIDIMCNIEVSKLYEKQNQQAL